MKLFKILGLTVAVLFAAVIAFGLYTAREAHHYQSVVGPRLQSQLGFTLGSPCIKVGEDSFEVFTLHPRPGGVLAVAGIRDGDIVLDRGITDFYRMLHEHRGSNISLQITDGGDGIPIAQRPVRSITLQVPSQQ